MKSFICETDGGEMVLTIRYNPEYENFKLYLHGIQVNHNDKGNINFYKDMSTNTSKRPGRTEILQAADRLIRNHYYWPEENQRAFEKWFDELWKQSHPEFDGEPVFMEDTVMIFA